MSAVDPTAKGADSAIADQRVRPMTAEERKVIFASSLGTVFEWYDFYLYGSMAATIGAQFFSQVQQPAQGAFALLAFAAGFIVRPLGAIVFGRLGDLVGRKYTFLLTIMIMGIATLAVGLTPNAQTIGIAAPIVLVSLRLIQGLALGGEYGGAAIYVAEHAPQGRRGFYTSWIQTTASLGLLLSLLAILSTRSVLGEDRFADWGWRLPFLMSAPLLGVSLWVRLKLNESPAFQKMKAAGKGSKAPLTESFGRWGNAKYVLIALFGLVAGQGVVWYAGQFYALFFLQGVLRVDGYTASLLVAWALVLSAGFFVIFGWLSDKVGRKPIILSGCLIAALTYMPIFREIAALANPRLTAAERNVKVTATAFAPDCGGAFDPLGTHAPVTACDLARRALTQAGVNYKLKLSASKDPQTALNDGGSTIAIQVNDVSVIYDGRRPAESDRALLQALDAAGYPRADDPGVVKMNNPFDIARPQVALIVWWLFILNLYVTMVYGPIAAALVELFPTRIRYTSMSLPYHIGNGWFGGLLPTIAFGMSAWAGDIFFGLWYPIAIALMTATIGLIFVPETSRRDLYVREGDRG